MISCFSVSSRAEALSELLASIRRQGVRAENILKDGDNLLQRIRNLESRLRGRVEAHSSLQEDYSSFKAQADRTRTWIRDLSGSLGSAVSHSDMEEMKDAALVSGTRSATAERSNISQPAVQTSLFFLPNRLS